MAEAVALSPTEENYLRALAQLKKHYPTLLVKTALETAIWRHKAQAKFSRAEAMYFTREALEMASSEIISRYRAERFKPFQQVADLACGLGGDTLGLAADHTVTAVDISPLHLALTEANLAAYSLSATLVQGDLAQGPLPQAEAYFFDPGRRVAGRRLFSVQDYQPPLSIVQTWLPRPLGVKISPGVQLNELSTYDCEIEFISLDGDLKECVLWFGPFKTATTRATLLSKANAPLTLTAPPLMPPAPPLSVPKAYLYEPDAAILRAGLVVPLAVELGAAQLDADIAYLTSNSLTPSPFVQAFAIEAALPFSQKRLREQLRAMNVGRVTVKKRGSPLDPIAFARSLKLTGEEERIVFLTHVQGQPWALIGTRL